MLFPWPFMISNKILLYNPDIASITIRCVFLNRQKPARSLYTALSLAYQNDISFETPVSLH